MLGDSEKIEVAVEACGQCGDNFDNHAVIVTTEQPPIIGGIVLCPVPGCDCFSTWSRDGVHAEQIEVPSEEGLAQLRQAVQEVYSS